MTEQTGIQLDIQKKLLVGTNFLFQYLIIIQKKIPNKKVSHTTQNTLMIVTKQLQ